MGDDAGFVKGNDAPFTGLAILSRSQARRVIPGASHSPAQEAGSESPACGHRNRAACPAGVRA